MKKEIDMSAPMVATIFFVIAVGVIGYLYVRKKLSRQ